MMVIVERTERLVPHNLHSKSLGDPLNRKVAELLKFIFFHILANFSLGRESEGTKGRDYILRLMSAMNA